MPREKAVQFVARLADRLADFVRQRARQRLVHRDDALAELSRSSRGASRIGTRAHAGWPARAVAYFARTTALRVGGDARR